MEWPKYFVYTDHPVFFLKKNVSKTLENMEEFRMYETWGIWDRKQYRVSVGSMGHQ